jgi:hypothetical protein
MPVPAGEYVAWYRAIADNVAAVLAPSGSYFLNIKEHADDGERSLYVKDLTLAHARKWGWRFVDEFCWRNTRNGVPGAGLTDSRTPGNPSSISRARLRSSSTPMP